MPRLFKSNGAALTLVWLFSSSILLNYVFYYMRFLNTGSESLQLGVVYAAAISFCWLAGWLMFILVGTRFLK